MATDNEAKSIDEDAGGQLDESLVPQYPRTLRFYGSFPNVGGRVVNGMSTLPFCQLMQISAVHSLREICLNWNY